MEISVIIPAFNEEEVISQTISEVKNFLQNNFESFEIIIVDDKSTDSTLSILKKIGGIKILPNLKNHGKGYSVVKGIKASQGNLILYMDADSSTKISELINFVPYMKDFDMVVASRAVPGSKIEVRQNVLKVWLGKSGNLLIRLILGVNVRDTQCGFKLLKKEIKPLLEKLTIEDWGFDFELIFLVKQANFSIKELPITWKNNFDSKVKWHSYFKTVLQVFKVRINYLLNKY